MVSTVLHLVHKFPPAVGGTAQRLLSLLPDSEHRHLVCCLRGWGNQSFVPDTTPSHEEIDGIPIHRFRYPTPWINVPWTNGCQAEVRFSKEILRALSGCRKIDIVNAHSPMVLGRVAGRLAKSLKTPLIYEYHQVDIPFVDRPKRRNPRQFRRWQLENSVLQKARRIVLQTEMQRARITRLFDVRSGKLRILPMGVSAERFGRTGTRLLDRTDRLRFGLIGNLSSAWGAHDLLTFFMENMSHDHELVVAGDGDLRHAFEDAGRNHSGITFLGLIPSEKMGDLYRSLDFLIVPCPDSLTWSENNPTKLFEAMACGLPIIGTRVKGIESVLGSHGIYFDLKDLNSLADAISVAKDMSSSVRSDLGRELNDMAISNHSWAPICNQLDAIYTSVYEESQSER